MAKTVVVAHGGCYDGFAAAYVARLYFQKMGVTDVEYIFAKYGDPAPDVQGTVLYIVDFSYPKATLEKLAETNAVTVLDHHKTAQANCEGLSFCTFDMGRSGAGLAWDHLFPDQERPAFVNYVEDRDLWRFQLPGSREVSAYIASFPRDFEVWDGQVQYLDVGVYSEDIAAGKAILRFERQKVEEICKEAHWREIGGHQVPVVNCPYNFGSLCGERLNQLYPDAPFSAYFFVRGDGETQYGLRSTGFDVSEVAKQYGGGGHQRASGFVMGKVTR